MDKMINLWEYLDTHGFVKTIEEKIGCKYSEINASEENRINAITAIAAISRGNDASKSPEGRYKALLKEASPNYTVNQLESRTTIPEKIEDKFAGRPLEYCPVLVYIDFNKESVRLNLNVSYTLPIQKFNNKLGKYSHIEYNENGYFIKTNLRALLNAGIRYEDIPYNTPEENYDYFIAEVKTPYFSFAQIRTHAALSQVAVSDRYTELNNGYWLPEDLLDKVNDSDVQNYILTHFPKSSVVGINTDKFYSNPNYNNLMSMFKALPVNFVKDMLKTLGYKKEIYNRYPNFLEFKRFIIGGYLEVEEQWGHLLLERNAYPELMNRSGVQKETAETARALRSLIIESINS